MYKCMCIKRAISHIIVQIFPIVQYLQPAKLYALEEFDRFDYILRTR